MNFKSKLSRRLAVSRPLLLTATLVAAGCATKAVDPSSPTLDAVVLMPNAATLQSGQMQQFAACGRVSDGDSVDVAVTFTATGGTITAGGLFAAGQTAGVYQVIATESGGTLADTAAVTITSVASVDVMPDPATVVVGQTVQLTATPRDASGNALSGRVVSWSSSDAVVATVNNTGLVSGVGVGSATITATSEGQSGTTAISVVTGPVASVEVSPGSARVVLGATVQLRAQPRDAGGNPLDGREATWSSSNDAAATVDASGLVTGQTAGSATITATSGGVSGTATIEVVASASTSPNFKVAFIGDQADGQDALDVLQLIRDEGADMVIHGGDFDYGDDPNRWDDNINSVLGADFPYFASVGNHDVGAWGGYQQKLEARLARVADATCTGDLGVESSCHYQGLFFILSDAGTLGSDHETYIRQELSQDDSDWSVCSWHKNQREMQVGGKGSSVGWGPYTACREEGAIIATGHEHSYSRTKTLVSMEKQTVDPDWSDPADVRVAPGATFAFVSGLGGTSIRDQERCLPRTYPYGCNGEWASIYTSDQGAQFGALFIEFHVDGDPGKAHGYFMNVDGEIIDDFTITGTVGAGGVAYRSAAASSTPRWR